MTTRTGVLFGACCALLVGLATAGLVGFGLARGEWR